MKVSNGLRKRGCQKRPPLCEPPGCFAAGLPVGEVAASPPCGNSKRRFLARAAKTWLTALESQVFVSSLTTGMHEERAAVWEAIEQLDHDPIMSVNGGQEPRNSGDGQRFSI